MSILTYMYSVFNSLILWFHNISTIFSLYFLCISSSIFYLEKLKLGWNMIRLQSATALASSLAINATVVYLDLSSNSLGRDGGEALGAALFHNKVLKTLLLSNNGIESRACFTLCMGIIENTALKKGILTR